MLPTRKAKLICHSAAMRVSFRSKPDFAGPAFLLWTFILWATLISFLANVHLIPILWFPWSWAEHEWLIFFSKLRSELQSTSTLTKTCLTQFCSRQMTKSLLWEAGMSQRSGVTFWENMQVFRWLFGSFPLLTLSFNRLSQLPGSLLLFGPIAWNLLLPNKF